ncbi:MAG: IS1182 family transposase, partial [Chitinophagaceae bacterium]
GGTSSFHPRMLLKVLVYAYINNIYSSRKIEEALQQNIHFMWLAAGSKPDHNTINRFRSERLKDVLRAIFTQVVSLLVEEGLLNIKELYVDGTKIESAAGRYTFVWGKAIKTARERIKTQLDELWAYAQGVAALEAEDTDPTDFDPIDPEKVAARIEQINEALTDKPVDKKVQAKLRYAEKNWPSKLKQYQEQEKVMGEGRNSYSKTDPGATFMRMKEDHMKNGQLKPAYNVQIATNNQFIATYSLHQSPSDTTALLPLLVTHEKAHGVRPQAVITDAGYGSHQNYAALEQQHITAYVKHRDFDREQSSRLAAGKPYAADKLAYDEAQDEYRCPSGAAMIRTGGKQLVTTTGFIQDLAVYEAKDCSDCPLRAQCHDGSGNRIIEVNHELRRHKAAANERLKSEEGIAHRKRRCWDVEPVFGNIKNNHGFRRFMLRGTEKVEIEVGLLALAHNLRKKVA